MNEKLTKTNEIKVPELLMPGGSLQKAKIAALYGADAIYGGFQKYGLRAAADNFDRDQLKEVVDYCHERDVKFYLTLNSFFHEEDYQSFLKDLNFFDQLGIDAYIISDVGVMSFVSENSGTPIHVSTQASVCNAYSAKAFKSLGAKRVVLGREVSLEDAKNIKDQVDVEIEMFIHGSMCMAFSGNCVISNYTAGRDSNRGGCAHSCRFEYKLKSEEQEKVSTFMSSKDLNGLELLGLYTQNSIDTIKVEGRMKSVNYVGTVASTYSHALNEIKKTGSLSAQTLKNCQNELLKTMNREFTTASLVEKADQTSIFNEREYKEGEYQIVGEVLEVNSDQFAIVKVRAPLFADDRLELLIPESSENNKFTQEFACSLKDVLDRDLEKANPGKLIKIPFQEGMQVRQLIRKVTVASDKGTLSHEL
ncbi:MAG: U32 family peptidase [Bacteriovoracaceae bacterium]